MRFIFLLFYIANGQMPGQFRPQMFEEKKETSEDWVLDPVVQGILFSWIVSNSVVKIEKGLNGSETIYERLTSRGSVRYKMIRLF